MTGLLVDNSTEAWRVAILRLIDDAALRTRMQRQARQYVAEHYAQEKFEDLFLAQLEELVESRKGRAGPSATAEQPSRFQSAAAQCDPFGAIKAVGLVATREPRCDSQHGFLAAVPPAAALAAAAAAAAELVSGSRHALAASEESESGSVASSIGQSRGRKAADHYDETARGLEATTCRVGRVQRVPPPEAQLMVGLVLLGPPYFAFEE